MTGATRRARRRRDSRSPTRPASRRRTSATRARARTRRSRSTSQGLPAVDNGRFTVHIDWGDPDTDWDLYIYDAAGNVVAQSASFGDTTEDAVLFDPPAGHYTAVIVNYDQVDGQPYDDWGNGRVDFESPRPRVENPDKEAWTLTCEPPGGPSGTPIEVIVDRGGRADVGDACASDRAPRKR